MIIREAELTDAEKLAELLQHVDESSDYMLYEAGERIFSIKKQENMIEDFKNAPNSVILVAEVTNQLAGFLIAVGGKANRNRHSAYLVLGIGKEYRGQGVGQELLRAAEKWAIGQQVTRLELTVVTKNEPAIHLYKKMGFEMEGRKRNSLRINGEYTDEYYMAKLIF
jgi:RimJ/RimL family protein N-acetyltransferase